MPALWPTRSGGWLRTSLPLPAGSAGPALSAPGSKKVAHQQEQHTTLGACPNSRCSILSESDSTLGHEQIFSPLEYRSDTASATECAGLRTEGPCFAVYC